MERVLTGDEKIRKAEEIYYRRKMGLPYGSKTCEQEKKTYLGSKILFQILLILNISIIIVAVQNRDFIFTQEFLALMAEYNVNLGQTVKELVGEEVNQESAKENITETKTQEPSQPETNIQEPTALNAQEPETNTTEPNSAIVPNGEDAVSKTPNYNFQKPIEGTVTSRFGARESVYQNVSGYHTGVDIGAEKGTLIKAALGGQVVLVSSEGDYGKHLKIQNGDMTTLYAHCSKILVKEGDYVNSGQEIAKVGSTGNSTRSTPSL